jgi:glutathione S-transferase
MPERALSALKETIMQLYGFPPSPNTWKVRAVGAHLGLPLPLELVDLTKGAQRAPDYLALNPTGRTPTLVDGDFKLWESNAIVQYLAEKAENTLWPADTRARANISRWQCWQLAHWGAEACGPLTFQRMVKKLLNAGPPDDAVVAKATEAFNRNAAMIDAVLSKQPYLTGEHVTLADFAVAAAMIYNKEAEMPIAPYAHLRNWFERVMALPCWRQTAPRLRAVA